jgi:hypothetical protein
VSFGTYARKVRDAALPFGRRVSALRSCVQLYGPIGFNNSLSFLEEIAGRYQSDEAALLRALDALVASRAQWHVVLEAYAQTRRAAKLRGQRSPRPDDPNPNRLDRWHGDARRAALHIVRKELAELAARVGREGPSSEEMALRELVSSIDPAQGQLSPDQRDLLSAVTASLHTRLSPELSHDDQAAYVYVRRLLRLAELLDTVIGSGSPSLLR